MAEWSFRKKSKGEVERDPGWDEYFTSNRSTEESLVREAIQNSLDAHSKCESLESQSGPAVIREILTYAFIENDSDELGEWTEDWKLFAHALGAEEFPQLAGGDDRDDDTDALRKWIDSAVQAFVRGKGLADIANQWKDDAE